jgi:hypothetical protein
LPRKKRAHFFCFLNKLPGSRKSAKCLFIISMKFPIDRIIMPYLLKFWDFGQIMAMDHCAKSQNRDSRVFSSSPWNFWFIGLNHALYWKFGTLAGMGSRPQMTMYPKQKTFKRALSCSILIAGTQVMFRKAYFLGGGPG